MKKVIYTLGLSLLILEVSAQVVNSTKIHISEGALVSFGSDVTNNGEITNNGKLHLKGDFRNDAKVTSKGQVVVDGDSPQTFNGSQTIELAKVSIENDLNLQTKVSVSEDINFNRGIVNAISPLELTENATATGASDFSHVAGVMRKTGNSSFEFPLGDGVNYKGFEVKDQKGTLEARYVGNNPMDVSSELDYNVEEINQTEYWVLKSVDKNTGVEINLKNNDDVAYLKSGVWVKETNKLSDVSNTTMFTSGKGKNIIKEIGVWPNPTQGEFNLKLTGMRDSDNISVEIVNQDGRNVMRMNGTVKELRKAYTLPNGLATTNLTIRVVNGTEAMTQNIILNR
jgi:hypothetical protein